MSGAALWAAVVALAIGTYLLRSLGVVVTAGRSREAEETAGEVDGASAAAPGRVATLVSLLPVVLLAALVAVQTVAGEGGRLVVDARVLAMGAAAVALAFRAPFLVVMLAAAVVAAIVRACVPGT